MHSVDSPRPNKHGTKCNPVTQCRPGTHIGAKQSRSQSVTRRCGKIKSSENFQRPADQPRRAGALGAGGWGRPHSQGRSDPSAPQILESPCGGARFFGKLMWVWRLPRGPRRLGLRESASAKKGVKPRARRQPRFSAQSRLGSSPCARDRRRTSSLIHSTNPRIAIRGAGSLLRPT